MYIFNNLKDFSKMSKIFYGFGVLSWLMVMVGCSPVEPGSGSAVREVVKISVNDGSGDYDRFGEIVALDGNTAILSAGGEGAAYIFIRNGNSWIQQAKLTPPSGDRSFSFGALVAISGDYAIVGGDGNFFAYIFVRNGTNWTRQATLTSGQFGSSVGIDGNTAIVGESEDGGADRENGLGSAHIYTRDGTNWTRQKILTPSDTSDYSHRFFGHSVAISDNTVIVGAYGGAIITIGPPASVTHRIKGFAYIFTRDGTNWVQQAKLENTNGRGPVERYGWSVAIDGDYAVVGDFLEGREGLEYQTGSAYIFNRSGNNWIQQAKIKASDGGPNDYFGWSVAIDRDIVVVSAWGDDDNGSASGSSYIFTRSGTSWNQLSKFAASDSALLNHFGKSVAIDGETIVVGATEFIGASIGNQFGLTYIYEMNR